MKHLLAIIAIALFAHAGVVTKTTVQSATGTGEDVSYQKAVDKAIAMAVAKLNGAYVVSKERMATNMNKNNGKADFRSEFEQKISLATKGRFSSFDILEEREMETGWRIKVKVVKKSSSKYYKVPGQNTNQHNLVIVQSFNDLDVARFGKEPLLVAHDLKKQLTNEIYKAHKFRILDRDNSAATSVEERFIKNHAAKDEALRLGLNLGADFLLIYKISRMDFQAGKVSKFTGSRGKDVMNVVVDAEVILLATKEVKFSTTVNFTRTFKDFSTSAYTNFIADLAAQLSNELHDGIYPPVIEAMAGAEGVVTQKLPVGTTLECFKRGGVVTDSRTKARSYAEIYAATASVVRSNEKQSYLRASEGSLGKGHICRIKKQAASGEAASQANMPGGGAGAFIPTEYGGGF